MFNLGEDPGGPISPLVLDIDGDGIPTSNIDHDPVYFDLDADGAIDEVGWIAARTPDAFLWLDLNRNDAVDDGGELFGNRTLMPNGEHARNGFDALAAYDQIGQGGNGDGRITRADAVWSRLRLWNDWNHDGVAGASETSALAASGVVAISSRYARRGWKDSSGNLHHGIGRYWAEIEGEPPVPRHVEDLWFVTR